MARSTVQTVDQYLGRLSPEQQEVIATIRDLILRNLPKGFQESMTWGVPTYEVPLERYPDTYNGKPLGYAALAAKKNYYTLHLMSVYGDPQLTTWLENQFARRGKRLEMGKACVRFKRLDDLPLDVMAEIISKTTLEDYVARIDAGRKQYETQKRARASSSPSRRKPARRAKTMRKTTSRKASRLAPRRKAAKKPIRTR